MKFNVERHGFLSGMGVPCALTDFLALPYRFCCFSQLEESQSQCQAHAAQLNEAWLKIQEEKDLVKEVCVCVCVCVRACACVLDVFFVDTPIGSIWFVFCQHTCWKHMVCFFDSNQWLYKA